MTVQPLKVAFVGAGRMAREHIRAFSGTDDVLLAGIASRTRSRAETIALELGIHSVCSSVADLYVRSKPDIVVVAVPEPEANSVLKQCFKYPWLILTEKPVGLDLDDALNIQSAARSANARVLVGLNRRSMSSTIAAASDLTSNSGRRFIHVQDQQSLAAGRAMGYSDEIVRNWMYGNSIHLIDYFHIFGRGTVETVTQIEPWQPNAPGLVLARLDFSSGDIGLYEGIWDGPGPWACTVSTARKRWELRPLENARYQNEGERVLHSVPLAQEDIDFKPGFRRQALHVIAAARNEPCFVPDLDEATRTMRLISRIFSGCATQSR